MNFQEKDGTVIYQLKIGSDHAQLSEELWRFFTEIYGGGPEVYVKAPIAQTTQSTLEPPTNVFERRPSRKYSESDKEDYCSKSTSEINLQESIQSDLQKNTSLQNINRHYKVSRTADSDEDVNYRHSFQYKSHEANGNYDSDDDMDVSPTRNYTNTVRMENGVDSSDHDANDNPIYTKKEKPSDTEINRESVPLKGKNPPKSGKRKMMKKRTVK